MRSTVRAWCVSSVSSWRCSGWCCQSSSWQANIRRERFEGIETCLIHWGIGRFCFIFLASFLLIRKVFKADILATVHFLSERIVDSDLVLHWKWWMNNHRFYSKKLFNRNIDDDPGPRLGTGFYLYWWYQVTQSSILNKIIKLKIFNFLGMICCAFG